MRSHGICDRAEVCRTAKKSVCTIKQCVCALKSLETYGIGRTAHLEFFAEEWRVLKNKILLLNADN